MKKIESLKLEKFKNSIIENQGLILGGRKYSTTSLSAHPGHGDNWVASYSYSVKSDDRLKYDFEY